MTYVPGRITRVERAEHYVIVSIENVAGHTVDVHVTSSDNDEVWAAGEYWTALMEHSEQLHTDIEDEMRDMGIWKEEDAD